MAVNLRRVDLSVFLAEPISRLSQATEQHHHVAHAIDRALCEDGAFSVDTNGCITAATMQAAFSAASEFFAADTDAKKALPSDNAAGFIRGYLPVGAESGTKSYFEPKEGFSFGCDWPAETPRRLLKGPNRWPQDGDHVVADAAAFRATMMDMYTWSTNVSKAVVAAVAVALEQDPEQLLQTCQEGDGISLMRLFHYFPSVEGKNCLGSSPHSDWGFLTVILQDKTGGLQILKHDEWCDVAANDDHRIVVNGGDYLRLLTSKRYHSPIHRVLCPKESRLSFVLFYYPNPSTKLSCDAWKGPKSEGSTESAQQDTTSAAKPRGYNTLLDQLSHDASFDEYICAKWAGVQRT